MDRLRVEAASSSEWPGPRLTAGTEPNLRTTWPEQKLRAAARCSSRCSRWNCRRAMDLLPISESPEHFLPSSHQSQLRNVHLHSPRRTRNCGLSRYSRNHRKPLIQCTCLYIEQLLRSSSMAHFLNLHTVHILYCSLIKDTCLVQ